MSSTKISDVLTVRPFSFSIAVPFASELGKESVCKKDASKIIKLAEMVESDIQQFAGGPRPLGIKVSQE